MKKLVLLLFVFQSCLIMAQDAESHFKKAEEFYNNDQIVDAIKEYTKAIEIDQAHMNSYLRRGFAHNMLEKYDDAVKDFSKVIEINPKHVWAYISRGSAYNKLSKYKEALDDFNKAISIDPENQEAYNNRGWAKKFLGDTDGACEDWNKSKKLGNGEAKIILKNNRCK